MSITLRQGTDNVLGCQLTYCPRCGGEGRDLILTGARRTVIICPSCGTHNFGSRQSETCGKCRHSLREGQTRKMEEHEKLPGGLCENCEKEVALHKQIVSEGGIFFKCKECGQSGVIKSSAPLSMTVREAHDRQLPEGHVKPWFTIRYGDVYKPCGVEFVKCEEHTPKED